MRLPCPFCGERDSAEFVYLGDAAYRRPDPAADNALALFIDAVYLRDNPAGEHDELWHHAHGCRNWLRVRRNTRNHAVISASLAKGDAE